MGKQQKLKAQRRKMREAKKAFLAANPPPIISDTPPDLGVSVAEMVKTVDKFG